MKRMMAVLLAVLMAFSPLITYASASTVPTISVGTVEGAAAGSSVTLDVSISSNPGIGGLAFAINYDHSKLLLTGFENGGLSGWLVGIGQGEKASWTTNDYVNNNTFNGTILKLTFSVLENAAGTVSVSITEVDAVDVDAEEVSFSTEAGRIVISREHIPDELGKQTLPTEAISVVETPTAAAVEPEAAAEKSSVVEPAKGKWILYALVPVCLCAAGAMAARAKRKKQN